MLCMLITMSFVLKIDCYSLKIACFNFACMIVSSFLTHVDIDECAENSNGCNQLCTNTPGSYACYCNVGYELSSDQKTCVGKPPFNLYTFRPSHYVHNPVAILSACRHQRMCYRQWRMLSDMHKQHWELCLFMWEWLHSRQLQPWMQWWVKPGAKQLKKCTDEIIYRYM